MKAAKVERVYAVSLLSIRLHPFDEKVIFESLDDIYVANAMEKFA